MKVNMNRKLTTVGLVALALTFLVGCGGNKTVAPPPPIPPSNPQFGGGSAGCGGGGAQTLNSYFTSLINVTQAQQTIPSSLTLTFNPNGGTQVVGPQPGQNVQVSGCFNWADLPLYFTQQGGNFGQTPTNIQTAIQMQSQGVVTVQSNQQSAFVSNMVLFGQTSLPSWGAASTPTQITMFVQQAYLGFGGRLYVTQPAQVYVNGQPMMPTGQHAPAYVTPQQ